MTKIASECYCASLLSGRSGGGVNEFMAAWLGGFCHHSGSHVQWMGQFGQQKSNSSTPERAYGANENGSLMNIVQMCWRKRVERERKGGRAWETNQPIWCLTGVDGPQQGSSFCSSSTEGSAERWNITRISTHLVHYCIPTRVQEKYKDLIEYSYGPVLSRGCTVKNADLLCRNVTFVLKNFYHYIFSPTSFRSW